MEDVLQHQEIAAKIYPKNKNIEATIKRNISILINEGKLKEISENKLKKI